MATQAYKSAPAFDPNIERCCLSLSAFYRDDGYSQMRELIGEGEAFFVDVHRHVWQTIVKTRQECPLKILRPETLERHATHPSVTIPLLQEILSVPACGVNAEYYAGELLKLWRLRTARDKAGLIARCADARDAENMDAELTALVQTITPKAKAFTVARCADAGPIPTPLFCNGLPAGGFGLVIGSDGIGKGFLLLDMLLSFSMGRPLNVPTLARTGPPLKIAYLCFEDETRWLHARLDAICAAAGLDADAWLDAERDGRLSIICDAGPLFIQHGHGVPEPTGTLSAVRRHIADNKIDLLVVDPLSAAAMLQNENDNSALNAVAVSLRSMAAETGCAVILVHHTSKGARNTSGDHQSARGGSSLGGAARWALTLTDDADSGTLSAAVAKNSYGRRVYDIILSRGEDGVLREISGNEIGQQKDALIASVVSYVRDHPDVELNPNAIKFRNSAAAQEMLDVLGVKPKTAYDAIQRAVKRGELAFEERQKANRSGVYDVLILPDFDDDSEVLF